MRGLRGWQVRKQDSLLPPPEARSLGDGGLERTLGGDQRLASKPQPLPRFHQAV